MRRLRLFLAVLGLVGPPIWALTPVYVTPDVPTDETASGTQPLPWQIFRYQTPAPSYAFQIGFPGNPTVDAIERMDKLNNWLFSLESASDLGGSLPAPAEPRDVIRYDGTAGTYALFFCGAGAGIPLSSNVDAIYLRGGDLGELVISFDVPTTIGATTYDPADLLVFKHVLAGCGGWSFSALAFDASAAGTGIPTSSNVIGAESCGGKIVLSLDVPTALGPPLATYVPGQLVAWDGATFALFEGLSGWPISSGVDGVACAGNAGLVPPTVKVNKAVAPNLQLVWQASCSQGAENYGIYEGTIGTWYSHTQIDCADAGGDLVEVITPAAGNRYYLVVAHGVCGEGSYGQRTGPIERPVGAAVCAAPQVLTSCP